MDLNERPSRNQSPKSNEESGNKVHPESLAPANVQLSYNRQKEEGVINENEPETYDTLSSCGFFFTHSYRDVGRKKCHFCLSFCSVFIVVWAALLINTIVEKGPIIFLKLGEGEAGQYDGIIYPTKSTPSDGGYANSDGIFINYTRVQQITNEKYNFSPRKQWCGSKIGSDKPARYDEEFVRMKSKNYVTNSDGLKMPPREEFYMRGRD